MTTQTIIIALNKCALEMAYDTTVPDAFYKLAKEIQAQEEIEARKEALNHQRIMEEINPHGQD